MSPPRALTAVAFAVMVAVAARAPLVDRDEPRYAQAVREMRQTGDLMIPRNFGVLRPDKPILVYWLQLAATAVLGERELAFRLPSLLALVVWLRCCALFSRELTGDPAWALVPGMAVAGIFATPDAVVGALTTGCLVAFLRAVRLASRRWVALGWGLMGLGILAKGPVTPLFALPAVAGYCGKDRTAWRTILPWWGPVLASGLVALWFVPANLATSWELGRLALGKHIVRRAMVPLESHGVSGFFGVLAGPPFYAASLALASFPLAGGFLRFLRREGEPRPQVWRTVVWGVGAPLLVLTLAATKLPHYILPAVPLVVAAARPAARQQAAASIASAAAALVVAGAAAHTPYRDAAAALRAFSAPTCAFSPHEPSLRFYAGEKLRVITAAEPCAAFLLRPGEQGKLPSSVARELEPVAVFSGWNLAKGRKERLVLYQVRRGLRAKENPGPGGSSAETLTGRGFILAAKNGLPTTRRAAILAR